MSAATRPAARRLRLSGQVQGVGFRPHVDRLARALRLGGWVRNLDGSVEIHVEGARVALEAFLEALERERPALARVDTVSVRRARTQGCQGFLILESRPDAGGARHLPPDRSPCPRCLEDMHDPENRRYRYPFVHCTECGPRYTQIDRLPYDRANTAMAGFPLCARCRAEYHDPRDRRYHAEALACPDCGPTLDWRGGGVGCTGEAALQACLEALRAGRIVAVKGVGGYHLMCDARNVHSLRRLRARKQRPVRPLAVLLPEQRVQASSGASALRGIARPSAGELAALRSAARPIVLMQQDRPYALPELLAPGLDSIGLMLPYSPLHHLLSAGFGGPLVATSANRSGEPVLTDNLEAEQALAGVAEAFLHHDRPIRRPADDPVWRSLGGRPRPMRPGRGLAPLELPLPRALPCPTLALGADLKAVIALGVGRRALLSPHIGDLGSARAMALLERLEADFQALYGLRAERVVCDAHPGYHSSRRAERRGLPVQRVLHHHAHASALYAEAGHEGDMLVFTWDGLGFGGDGSLWGGEALLGRPGAWRRVASLRPFRLPGGEVAAREPWRPALALCLEAGVHWPGAPDGAGLAAAAWARGLNCPWTSSAGRLFDAAAALIGVCRRQSHEAEAAMHLEALAAPAGRGVELPLHREEQLWRSDWAALLPMLMDASLMPSERAGLFHASLAGVIRQQAEAVSAALAPAARPRVGLTGGVFQNARLCALALEALRQAGFETFMPERLPVNDACIAFGQLVEAAAGPAEDGPG